VTATLGYAAVTPVRDDASNLERLATCMSEQTRSPTAWIIVDNGSVDRTPELAESLAGRHPWITCMKIPGAPKVVRGAPIVRAFHAGLEQVPQEAQIVVKLDADVSFADDYFARLVRHFEDDPQLGLASGTCYEWERGEWRPRFATRDQVRGATRAYRRACLDGVLPLEERMGWDSVDQLVATLRGWRTASFGDLPFYHHRFTGERDGSARAWRLQGELAHYLGYRPSYLMVRTAFRSVREPAATAMLLGYAGAVFRRERRCENEEVVGLLRRQQSLWRLPERAREALGRG
jgi:glycosyltransferase involved in cell wall biosynthesis